MAEAVSVGDIQLKESSGKGLCDYLREIKEEEDVEKIGHSRDILDLEQEKKKEIEDKLADKLLKALKNNDAFEVFALVENNHPIVSLNNVHQDCKDVADSECKDGKSRNYHCRLSSISNPFFCRFRGCRKNSTADEQQWEDDEQKNDEKKRKWIRILSNPLFISVEWLLKTKSTCQCEDCQRGKDVIEGALHDAYLLEKIASHEHYYDSDDYKRSVEAYETFAADVLEQSTSSELYEIMDIEGNGFLLQGKPQQLTNLNQSLRLLEIAAKKDRKKVRGYYCGIGRMSGRKIAFLFQLVCILISRCRRKGTQHFNATSCNIVARNGLHAFGHPVATCFKCCNMLDGVGSSLIMLKFLLQHF